MCVCVWYSLCCPYTGEASSLPPSVSEGRDTHPRATSSASLHSGTGSSHHRATSSASLHSEGRGQSSTSSSSLELSHASSSFNSKDLLEVSKLRLFSCPA